MVCCSLNDTVINNEYDILIKRLSKISVQIEPSWRGLYVCPECNTYWEESFLEDRFVDRPFLKRVTSQYVISEWGQEYLIIN